ncbi:hypothetical protein RHMOL_Rhmol12G0096400 [Rhododendron molle]|uniref:Uncharacterized protein n=1 Tax=Rhododendron molle TaxID=49168 RepID=A0ACC0LH70_RHOML|nr:hypothetical protein RHMOL_Rhmol12G0096400 [Rhododendron molle]
MGIRSCHQWRHKAMGLVASCKNKKKNKPCTTSYCKNCLLNRYEGRRSDSFGGLALSEVQRHLQFQLLQSLHLKFDLHSPRVFNIHRKRKYGSAIVDSGASAMEDQSKAAAVVAMSWRDGCRRDGFASGMDQGGCHLEY